MRHQADDDGRCVVTELPVDSCSGCRGHSDPVVDQLLNEGAHREGPGWRAQPGDLAEPAPDAHPFTAMYVGDCTALSNCRIRKGDTIIATRAGTYMHSPGCPAGKGW